MSAAVEFCVLGDELIWSDDWLDGELVLGEVLDVWATATAADSASTKINIIRRFLIRVSPRGAKKLRFADPLPADEHPERALSEAVWGRQRVAVHVI
jgi:hypothetical protein